MKQVLEENPGRVYQTHRDYRDRSSICRQQVDRRPSKYFRVFAASDRKTPGDIPFWLLPIRQNRVRRNKNVDRGVLSKSRRIFCTQLAMIASVAIRPASLQ